MSRRGNAEWGETIERRVERARRWLGALASALVLLPLYSYAGDDLTSYALIHDDATLNVAGRHLRLHGIHIPASERTCEHRIRPARCGSRAARALRFKIQGFVSCRLGGKYDDGSIAAYCRADGQDLGAYLIERGWAVALPDAPFAYHVSERIARHRGFGVWGFSADRITSAR
ncbi:MAG: nuclease-like protein [Gammaproteobacteria bacterium]|nr:nuclease-like protein [Gammaproteobacteria bacterium]